MKLMLNVVTRTILAILAIAALGQNVFGITNVFFDNLELILSIFIPIALIIWALYPMINTFFGKKAQKIYEHVFKKLEKAATIIDKKEEYKKYERIFIVWFITSYLTMIGGIITLNINIFFISLLSLFFCVFFILELAESIKRKEKEKKKGKK